MWGHLLIYYAGEVQEKLAHSYIAGESAKQHVSCEGEISPHLFNFNDAALEEAIQLMDTALL